MASASAVSPSARAGVVAGNGAAVATRRLSKLFGATPALLRAELDVPAGTVCALVGGNGAGKTTLLRILATAARPSSGSASVHGLDVVGQAGAVRRLVDFLPADGGLYLDLSALENLRFCVRMRALPASSDELAEAFAQVGLAGVADERLRTFSSGMLRRVGLARLIVIRPRVALLDEPYGGLDAEGRDVLDGLLREARDEGRTAIVATHEHERATALADVVYRLERGIADIERPALTGVLAERALRR